MIKLLCGNYLESNCKVLIWLLYIFLLIAGRTEVLVTIFSIQIGLEVLKVVYSIIIRRKLLQHIARIEKLAKENEKSL